MWGIFLGDYQKSIDGLLIGNADLNAAAHVLALLLVLTTFLPSLKLEELLCDQKLRI